jgi:serine/threonine protein kinase
MSDPRLPLAGRFAFAGLLRTSLGPRRWLAIENDTGRRVIAVATEAGRLATLESAKGIKHRHLASVVEVVRDVDPQSLPEGVVVPTAGGVAVAEYLPGTSLKQQLDAGALNPTKAVAWTLRLAESVQALHQAGGVHGAISPRAVVAEPEGRKIAPVLSQLLAQPVGAFCPPERLRGSVETSADDVWALHAVLFAMLARGAPFKGGARDALLRSMLAGRPKPLATFGVHEPVLDEILMRGLVGEKRLRVTDLPELVQALDGWERDRTVMPPKRPAMPRPASRGLADITSGAALGASRDDGVIIDDDLLPDDEGTEVRAAAAPHGAPSLGAPPAGAVPSAPQAAGTAPPAPSVAPGPSAVVPPYPAAVVPPYPAATPPEPPTAAPGTNKRPSKRVSINPFEKKKQIWPLLVGAALLSGGAVYLVVAPDATPDKPNPEPVRPLPPPAPTTAKSAKKRQSVAEDRDACVVAYFPEGAFQGTPNFEFVCSDKDFREIASALNQMVSPPVPVAGVAGGSSGGAAEADLLKADAGVKGSGLDWYELPATAIIRRHCCVASAPLTLPESAGWCEQLQSAVRRIADDSSKAVDLAPAARDFDKAVNCLFANKIARPYPYEKPPSDANRAAFQQFLGRAAVSDARR